MAFRDLETLGTIARQTGARHPLARIRRIDGTQVLIAGGRSTMTLGDRVSFPLSGGRATGEVVGLSQDAAHVVVEGAIDSLTVGQPAVCRGPVTIAPHDSWLGRVIDSTGRPVDGSPLLMGPKARNLRAAPPEAVLRRGFGDRLSTGLHVFNTLLPIVRGQRLGIFAGAGVGKSTLMGTFAGELEADVVIVGLVGERGREVGDFLRHVLGRRGMARSIVVVETSDRPALARRRAAEAAMTLAEHFRDAGKHVLLMIDSITRLAEAHREIAAASGELPSLRGFPPSLVPLLAALAERAGPGKEGQGDITAIFSVLVAGSDLDEPVADTLRGLLDGHVILSRTIAEGGRYPAVDVLRSISRSLPGAATAEENRLIERTRQTMSLLARNDALIRTGMYQPGVDHALDKAIGQKPALETFLGGRARDTDASSFAALALALDGPDDSDAA
ncbi:FliI/YscN family ATPase [Alphaproteobacteria bacterium GH1-50]|uniref:FliI/YscN family ATPase n=1 Tax=Kangsaoukella pontilimi TaxID=2691042 RepID=A0A7C9J3H8_9RHOB|nr:FliI/YscN family ATPase [Kangsaoukella pontilimi]MXQ08181.1 FliI/YscN family ATPase [Kangsaoukella pontilimi]